jgi:TPR repeat protein
LTDHPPNSEYIDELARRAEAGDSNAAFELGEIYREGEEATRNWKMVFRWYHLGATQGDAESQNNLGTLYQNGLGCEPDSVLAAHWYRQSAEQGNPVAQFNLGKRFHVGDGVDLDLGEAAHWYTLAARQGNTDAICDMGTLMRFGHGVPRDLVSAAALHLVAARRMDPVAIGNLCDYAEELQDIALSGNAKAAVHLSMMHHHGLGTEKDIPLTWTWIRWAKHYCPPPEDDGAAIEIDAAYEFLKQSLDQDDIEAGNRIVNALQKPVNSDG